MSQADFINSVYRAKYKETNGLGLWRNFHDMEITLERFDMERDKISFDSDDFPYIRAAMVDKYIEENHATD